MTAFCEPRNWKARHHAQLGQLDPDLRLRAAGFLRGWYEESGALEEIRAAERRDLQEWWAAHHFGWGMDVRNLLRRHGFGEEELGVGNLDDVYVGLVEEAIKL